MSSSPEGNLVSLAAEHHGAGRYSAAIELYQQLLVAGQGDRDSQLRLASALRSVGRTDEALDVYRALEEDLAGEVDFWFNRGNALADLGRHAEADSCFERAIAIDPDRPYPILNRAIGRAALGDEGAAIDLYRRVLALDPDHRTATHNLGNLLAERGRFDEATALLRRATQRWPDLAEAHYNLGFVLLRRGDYSAGAAEYEWRWRTSGFASDRPDYGALPLWDGQPFPGKRLVVHGEQGLGDTIQFSKLLGMVKSLCGDVVLHVPDKLVALMRNLPFAVEVTSHCRPQDFDFQIPLMSLVHRLKLTPGSIPGMPSHLAAPGALVADWAGRLGLTDGRRAIGLVWQGNPESPVDRGRSLASAAELAPFASLENIRLLALQKLDVSEIERADTPSGWRVAGLSFTLEHPGPDFDTGSEAFLDTAAIMARLDLIVSVCTAPLHLAGALGRPAIALLKPVPDWRWMMGTERTPWYPSMRLERQTFGEGYGPVISRAVERAKGMLGG